MINIEILNKILLGITLAAPIGPVSVEMIRRGLKYGFFSAFVVRLGGAIGNLGCLIISYYSICCLEENHFAVTGLSMLSLLLLAHRSYACLTTSIDSLEFSCNKDKRNGALTGLLLSVANPIAFIFWLGIVSNSQNSFNSDITSNLLIIVGVLIWGVIFSFFLSVGKNYLTQKSLLYINKISGLIMLYYCIKFFWINYTLLFF
jgi:L-lysine exporter family protein LysE/ArgO